MHSHRSRSALKKLPRPPKYGTKADQEVSTDSVPSMVGTRTYFLGRTVLGRPNRPGFVLLALTLVSSSPARSPPTRQRAPESTVSLLGSVLGVIARASVALVCDLHPSLLPALLPLPQLRSKDKRVVEAAARCEHLMRGLLHHVASDPPGVFGDIMDVLEDSLFSPTSGLPSNVLGQVRNCDGLLARAGTPQCSSARTGASDTLHARREQSGAR